MGRAAVPKLSGLYLANVFSAANVFHYRSECGAWASEPITRALSAGDSRSTCKKEMRIAALARGDCSERRPDGTERASRRGSGPPSRAGATAGGCSGSRLELRSGPRLARSKKLTPRAAERARPQEERAREALWLTRSSTVLTRHPRCCTSLWLMLPGRTWKGCTWRPVPMRHQSSSTGWTSTESAMI